MSTSRPRLSGNILILSALVAAILVVGVVRAAVVSIETWDEGQQTLMVDSTEQTDSSVLTTTASIGGERDIYLQWSSGTSGAIYAYVDYGGTSNRFSYTGGDGMMGWVTLQWDGYDHDAINLDNDGLSSSNVDLTDGGKNDSIHVVILAEDLRAILRFEVYADTPALNSSYATVNLPPINPGTRSDVVFPFNTFVAKDGGGANFTDVGAIVMILYGTVEESADVSVDFAQTDSAREYGDLPTGTGYYSTTMLAANHIPQGLRLGYNLDAESSPQPSIDASGDDSSNVPDDEDGVALWGTPWGSGTGYVRVYRSGCDLSNGCYINGWIDWNRDGDFGDTVGGASEHIINNRMELGDGLTQYSFSTPSDFGNHYYYARFRICTNSTDCDSPDNTDTNVLNGEIEDYRWPLGPTAVKLTSFAATPMGNAIRVAWETASEHNNAGFNLYRSTTMDEQGTQLNQQLIPSAAPGGDVGASYEFLDTAALPGQTYYYTLEDVDLSGVRTAHGPVVATAPYAIFLPLVIK